jgi:3',5'-cyclic AMP phosphodiesterase CpdA
MRILHISDLHFGAHYWREARDGGTHSRSFSESLGGCLHDPQIDALVVSGDITQQGSREEFALAASELKALAKALGFRDMRSVVVTPGNHDINWSDSRQNTNSKFDCYRGFLNDLYTPKLAAKLYPQNKPGFVGMHEIGDDVAVCSLSSCLYENHQDHYGYVGKEQLRRAVELLDASERFKIVATHHHLLPFPADAIPADPDTQKGDWVDASLIRDGGIVLQQLADASVRMVLHGHKHDPLRRRHQFLSGSAQGVIVLGAGSAGVRHQELPHGVSWHAQVVEVGGDVPVVQELVARNYQWQLLQREVLTGAYDELALLDARLCGRAVGPRTTLQQAAKKAAKHLQDRVFVATARELIEAMAATGVTEAQLEKAYWWLVVYGVLEFKGIDHWWDSDFFSNLSPSSAFAALARLGTGDFSSSVSWAESVDRAQIAARGRMLLHRLAQGSVDSSHLRR